MSHSLKNIVIPLALLLLSAAVWAAYADDSPLLKCYAEETNGGHQVWSKGTRFNVDGITLRALSSTDAQVILQSRDKSELSSDSGKFVRAEDHRFGLNRYVITVGSYRFSIDKDGSRGDVVYGYEDFLNVWGCTGSALH